MGKKTSVEVVIPIYNEEVELEDSIRKLHAYLTRYCAAYDWNITIADNASTDKSLAVAKKISKSLAHVSVFHMDQKGRGRAVKKVWQESKADILSYMDVDLSTDLKNFNGLISSLQKNADIAIGSRLLKNSKVLNRTPKREILSRGYNILIKIFFGARFSDAQCGFKAVTRRVVQQLIPHVRDNEWFFDSELLILGEKMGYTIHEEAVYWVDNPGSTVRVLGTVTGDLKGLWRLFTERPWKKLS